MSCDVMGSCENDHEVGLMPALPDDVAMQCLLRVPPEAHVQLQRVSRKWRELVNSPRYYEERKREGTSEKLVCMLQAVMEEEEPGLQSTGKAQSTSASPPVTARRSPVFGISVLNVHQRTWERLPPIPDFPEGLPIFSRLVAVDGKLIVLGGWNPVTYETLQSVYIFSFVTHTWSRGSPIPTSRSFFACAATENYVFVAGGHDNSKSALKSAEVYSVETNQWASLPTMHHERDESTGVCVENKFYVVSGYSTNTQGQFTQSGELYNPSTNGWTLLENMWSFEGEGQITSRPAGPFAVMFGKLYTLNGHSLCSFNAATGVWSVVEPIPDSEVTPVCVAVVDDALLVTGPSSRTSHEEDLEFGTFFYKPAERAVTKTKKYCKSEWQSIDPQPGFVGVAHASHAIEI